MSTDQACRVCGADLGRTGPGFGMRECCCNRGYCLSCCPNENLDTRPVLTVAASCQADGYQEYADGRRVIIPRIEHCACHPKREPS
jgi:hypothetical protein